MTRCIAVDLGVSTVRVAVRRGSRIVVLPGPGGARSTSADVILDAVPLVGETARRSGALASGRVVHNVLRQLESARSDEARRALSHLLRAVAAGAANALGEPADAVVVAVPASFDPAMRTEVGDAVRAAGLELRALVTDAVAGARAYAHAHPGHHTLLVLDIGAGTSHATIVDTDRDAIEVRATAGDSHLGGADVDERIGDLLAEQVQLLTGIDLRADAAARETLRRLGGQCKIALAQTQRAFANVPIVAAGAVRTIAVELSREQVVGELSDLFERWRSLVTQALATARAGEDDIDDVILLGGSADLPGLTDLWRQRLASGGRTLDVQSSETVVAGAAVEAAALDGHGRPVVIIDVAAAAISIRAREDDVRALVPHGASVPARRRLRIPIADPDAWSADLLAHVPSRARATAPNVIARIRLADPDAAPGEISLAIDLDANGMLVVAAEDPGGDPVELRRVDRPDTEED